MAEKISKKNDPFSDQMSNAKMRNNVFQHISRYGPARKAWGKYALSI